MIAKSLKVYLDGKKVKYLTISHSPAYSAPEAAHRAHVPGGLVAKTVVVFINGKPAMAVLPANQRIGVENMRKLTGTEDLRLAYEHEFTNLFPDCELGALPPFGNIYDMPTYVAPELAACQEICFNAGNHTEMIRMSWSDYESLVHPQVALFTA